MLRMEGMAISAARRPALDEFCAIGEDIVSEISSDLITTVATTLSAVGFRMKGYTRTPMGGVVGMSLSLPST